MTGQLIRGACAVSLGALMACSVGCSVAGSTPEEKRLAIQDMEENTLEAFYQEEPSLADAVDDAEGYAVFSNVGVKAVLLTGGGGYGVVHNNDTDEHTYMKMGQGGVGLGLGVKDFRALYLFHNDEALYQFLNGEWNFGADADAAVVSGEKGVEASGAAVAAKGVTVYQLTETGIVLGANLTGTRYWRVASLN